MAMELNVKQSGIVDRLVFTTSFKMRNRCLLRAVERYLRDDLSCGLHRCGPCSSLANNNLGKGPNGNENLLVPGNHAIIVDAETLMRFIDIFDSDLFQNIIITQDVWEFVKQKSTQTYKKLVKIVLEDKDPRFFVFMSEFHHETFVRPEEDLTDVQRSEKVLYVCAAYLKRHWTKNDVIPVILCAESDVSARLKTHYESSFTVKEYVQGMQSPKKSELLNAMAAYDIASVDEKPIYESYLSHDDIAKGIAQGTIKKGAFNVSRENYREAYVLVDPSTMTSWFVQGLNCNRAIDGDIVAVRLLPESEWTVPEKKVCLRDVEDFEVKPEEDIENVAVDEVPKRKRAKLAVIPTAKVVGIIKRNWRPYCGILMRSQLKNARRHLFCPSNRLIPRIRIETEQAEILENQRIVVSIDQWPRDSSYPLGHYVRALGEIGDREIENEVLLLEHDIPHAPFSDAVLDCLPDENWKPELESPRVDLRHLTVCSVDPLGCTDIDDALHCRPLDDDLLEVGVHIADVTHFVRSGTAIDEEAASRGTTVYLCDRRIDMLPALLSSNLCSLRGGEERYAFSVIWIMTSNAEVISTKYHKSLICSKAALTYEKAQEFIDDPNLNDDVTVSLRALMKLSKILNRRRIANGALTLASSEIRFDMDWQTSTPKSVQEGKHLDTHSMVEEFMLLANISVAEKILSEYPDCALLRRHPVPVEASYKPLLEAAKQRGFSINVSSGKALADSLNRAVDENNPMLNRLLRMLTTRCMTQAVYFSAGTVPVQQYQHFGLACPIYTHFTSPIRRYADVVVHRLLAACIGADDVGIDLLSQANVQKISQNINYRHKNAQYAARASVQLNVLTYFQGREETCEGFVMGVRTNGIQVFVPKYGVESVIVLEQGKGTTIDIDEGCVRHNENIIKELDRVKVRVRLDDHNVQRRRIALDLIEPSTLPGLSVDFDLSESIGIGIRAFNCTYLLIFCYYPNFVNVIVDRINFGNYSTWKSSQ
ncbi:exosome catalytic subunit dis3 [Parelaphostrongylus tenuis]|uniref:Protein DIS3 homolog n=1 Tax=Parelaphostrongylus tenuis TaxID=148309 RepID=A0AAD5QIA7_PARTN|nr:exosome catalytic subunit dis3 [Parelaphostrongylus tenuis]